MSTAGKQKARKVNYQLVGPEGGQQFLTVYVGAQTRVADSSHPSWKDILAKVKKDDPKVIDLFDAALAIANRFERLTDRVTVNQGKLYFDGDVMDSSLSQQILRFLKEGQDDWQPLVKFLTNVMENVEKHTRDQLFNWLRAESFTITDEGMILGYKSVWKTRGEKDTFNSDHRGTALVNGVQFNYQQIKQRVGDLVEMPRSAVRHDPNAACSVGLHVGTQGYANGFSGDTMLLVEVNPRDVVSVPNDSNGEKMRVCRYRIIKKIDKQRKIDKAVQKTVKPKNRGAVATVADAILGALGRRKKQGITAEAIIEATGLKPETVRTTISRMKKAGTIKVANTEAPYEYVRP